MDVVEVADVEGEAGAGWGDVDVGADGFVAGGLEGGEGVPPDESVAAGDEDFHGATMAFRGACSGLPQAVTVLPIWRSMSASTIMVTSCSKLTWGSHFSSALALAGLPRRRSTSAGRMKAGSMTT